MLAPRPLVALCLVLLAGLSWLADARPLPRIVPAQAAAWEGQAVVASGWATGLHEADAGGQRLTLRLGRSALDVRSAHADVEAGDWVEATGRIARLSGRLVLLADRLDVLRDPTPTPLRLLELAEHPQAWEGQPVRVSGEIVEGGLRDAAHRVPLRDGPWPPDGPAEVVGVLAYDPSCLCHVLEPVPWTPSPGSR